MKKIKYLNTSEKIILALFCSSLAFSVLCTIELFISYNDMTLFALIFMLALVIASGASLLREIGIVKRENILIRKMLDNLKTELLPHQIHYNDNSVFEVLQGRGDIPNAKDINKADLSRLRFAFKLDKKYFIINKYGCFETSEKELCDSIKPDDPDWRYDIDKLIFEAYEKHCLDKKQQNPASQTVCENIVKFIDGEFVLIFLNNSYSVHSKILAFSISYEEAEDILSKRAELGDIYYKHLTKTFAPTA